MAAYMGGGNRQSKTVGRTFGLGNRLEEMGERAGGVIMLIIAGFGECISGHAAVPLLTGGKWQRMSSRGEFKGSDENRSEEQRASQWTPSAVASDAMERPTRED